MMAMIQIITAVSVATAVTLGGGMLQTQPGQLTPAEMAFADAPDGVDPMVTGPTSKSFRQQQETAGCDRAAWPNIPLACFPD